MSPFRQNLASPAFPWTFLINSGARRILSPIPHPLIKANRLGLTKLGIVTWSMFVNTFMVTLEANFYKEINVEAGKARFYKSGNTKEYYVLQSRWYHHKFCEY